MDSHVCGHDPVVYFGRYLPSFRSFCVRLPHTARDRGLPGRGGGGGGAPANPHGGFIHGGRPESVSSASPTAPATIQKLHSLESERRRAAAGDCFRLQPRRNRRLWIQKREEREKFEQSRSRGAPCPPGAPSSPPALPSPPPSSSSALLPTCRVRALLISATRFHSYTNASVTVN